MRRESLVQGLSACQRPTLALAPGALALAGRVLRGPRPSVCVCGAQPQHGLPAGPPQPQQNDKEEGKGSEMQRGLHTGGLPISLSPTTNDRARGIGGKEAVRSCHVTSMMQNCLCGYFAAYQSLCVLLQMSRQCRPTSLERTGDYRQTGKMYVPLLLCKLPSCLCTVGYSRYMLNIDADADASASAPVCICACLVWPGPVAQSGALHARSGARPAQQRAASSQQPAAPSNISFALGRDRHSRQRYDHAVLRVLMEPYNRSGEPFLRQCQQAQAHAWSGSRPARLR